GTLTQNKMTIVEHYGDVKDLSYSLALCSDAKLNDQNEAEGEPTECALVNFAYKQGFTKQLVEKELPRVAEAPFDSGRKMMSTIHKNGDEFMQYTKGAPDEILKCCTTYEKGGEILPLTEEVRKEILVQNKAYADKALRVLAGAYRLHETMPDNCEASALEKDLTFIGLVGMIDPIRPEVL
ncbi:MAG: ATPase, partial [Oscillospiraceae bacterium]